MIVVPPALEDAVYAAAAAAGLAIPNPSALAHHVVDRSTRYTSDRAHLARAADADGDLAARALFFTICDAMKVAVPIAELVRANALPTARPLRVIDLGAGCGAMSLGLAAALAPLPDAPPLAVLAIDRDARALAIAQRALTALAPTATIAIRAGDVATAPLGTASAELVVLGSVLNELADDDARRAVVARALTALAPGGAVIVIEPALRETSRALHTLRDAFVVGGAAPTAHVFAPCTHARACPALVDARDWCHEDRLVELPPRTAQLARATHLRDGGLRFAYLVLRREPGSAYSVAAPQRAWRAVSAPMPAKGKHEIIGCGDGERVPIRLLKRHRTAATRLVERVRRGDVIVTAAEPEDGRVEITRDDTPALISI